MLYIVKDVLFIHKSNRKKSKTRVVVLDKKGFSIKKHKRSEEIIV